MVLHDKFIRKSDRFFFFFYTFRLPVHIDLYITFIYYFNLLPLIKDIFVIKWQHNCQYIITTFLVPSCEVNIQNCQQERNCFHEGCARRKSTLFVLRRPLDWGWVFKLLYRKLDTGPSRVIFQESTMLPTRLKTSFLDFDNEYDVIKDLVIRRYLTIHTSWVAVLSQLPWLTYPFTHFNAVYIYTSEN